MKYNKRIVDEIVEELKKIPNIRQVCKKTNINRSTFYRWMMFDDGFFKSVQDALFWGRDNVNEMAEGVIISGIQQGDSKSAQYWLSHNHERYIAIERVPYHQHLDKNLIKILGDENDSKDKFEALMKYQYLYEDIHGKEKAIKEIEPYVDLLAIDDPDIKELYFMQYERYKEYRSNKAEKKMRTGPDHPHAKEHRDEEERDREFDRKEKRGKK